MYLENCIYENNPKNVKRLEIGKDIRGVILSDRNIKQVTNQKNIKPILIQCLNKYDCKHIIIQITDFE